MLRLSSLATFACCCLLIGSCSSGRDQSSTGPGGAGGGAGGDAAVDLHPGEPLDSAGAGGGADTPPEEAGAAGAAGSAANAPDDPERACTVESTCNSLQCLKHSVSCDVTTLGLTCEVQLYAGASAPITCGERVTLGTACCGSCGCVPVEVYYDGRKCWQGIPQCTEPQVRGKFFGPHDPGPPTTSIYIPPSAVGGSNTGSAGDSGVVEVAGTGGGTLRGGAGSGAVSGGGAAANPNGGTDNGGGGTNTSGGSTAASGGTNASGGTGADATAGGAAGEGAGSGGSGGMNDVGLYRVTP